MGGVYALMDESSIIDVAVVLHAESSTNAVERVMQEVTRMFSENLAETDDPQYVRSTAIVSSRRQQAGRCCCAATWCVRSFVLIIGD
jgi:hypothetical protein